MLTQLFGGNYNSPNTRKMFKDCDPDVTQIICDFFQKPSNDYGDGSIVLYHLQDYGIDVISSELYSNNPHLYHQLSTQDIEQRLTTLVSNQPSANHELLKQLLAYLQEHNCIIHSASV